MDEDLEGRIATFVYSLDPRTLDGEVLEPLRRATLDCLAAILSGVGEEVSRQALAVVKGEAPKGPASVLGYGLATSVEGAALVNGTMAHVTEYDDISWSVWGHATAPVLPAVLAVAEWKNLSGRDLLVALLAGIEVATKIGRAVTPRHYERGWHSTGTLGVFGAAAGAAKALGLDEGGICAALGIAASRSAGLRANVGSAVKPLHVGFAARDGVEAARLAAMGVKAGKRALSGTYGFLAVMGEDHRPIETITASLGKPFDVVKPGFAYKFYPSCGDTHASVDAALALRARHGLDSAAVARVRIGITPLGFSNLTYHRPETPAQCKFSLEFCVSMALARGRLGLKEFEPDARLDPAVRSLMERTEVFVHPDLSGADSVTVCSPGIVEIETTSGQWMQETVTVARGGPENPLRLDELEAKFLMCADRALDPRRAETALDLIRRLHTIPSVRDLVAALAPPEKAMLV